MPGSGSPILAADYNNIWNLVNTVLGTGTGQYGYNQTLNSSQVSVRKTFKLADWVNLRTDIIRILTHQTGVAPTVTDIPVPGNLKPTTVSSATTPVLSGSDYLVTFNIPIQIVAPSVGASFKVTGCANTAYNGTYVASASTTTSVTLKYSLNPGVYNPAKPVLVASVLTYGLMTKLLEKAQEGYTNAHNPTLTITGSVSTSGAGNSMDTYNAAIIMLGASISGPGIPANTTVSSVLPGATLTLSNPVTSNQSAQQYTLTLTTGVKTVAANQLTTTTLGSVTRNSSWNQNIQTIGTFVFRDASNVATNDAARAFFNAGSQIEIIPALSGTFSAGSNIKDQTWQTMFLQIGKIIIRANDTIQDNTINSGTGIDNYSSSPSSPSSVGWFQLTTVPRLVFVKNAPSGAYATNAIYVYANTDVTGTQLLVTVRFQDDAGGNIDENVDGTLTVTFSTTYASGSNVSTSPPLLSTTPIQ